MKANGLKSSEQGCFSLAETKFNGFSKFSRNKKNSRDIIGTVPFKNTQQKKIFEGITPLFKAYTIVTMRDCHSTLWSEKNNL